MKERYLTQFWLRKLHSLTGVLFLGYFLCVHVRLMEGYEGSFRRWAFLFLPLLFHGLYGLYIIWESSPNNLRYPLWRNWMYLLQRISALVIVPFLLVHLADQRGWADLSGAAWFMPLWYLGLLAAVYHLANGLFGAGIEWGVTVGPHSQRVLVVVSFLAFLVLGGYGIHTLYANF
jgi:succinate dehydrogenase / fumarate reductase cytochrome b subunit